MFPQHGELRPTNGRYRFRSSGSPANFNRFRILPLLLQRRRSSEANQTLHVWPAPALVYYVYIFRGSCPNRILPGAKFTVSKYCVRLYWQRYGTHGTPAVGVSQTLWCGTCNGITELSQRVPPIFGWAAITLGFGTHSSTVLFHFYY